MTKKFALLCCSASGITDENGNVITPRAIYKFYDGSSTVPVNTQIVKNQERLQEVDSTPSETQVFVGWYLWENDSYGEQVVFDTPIQVLFGSEEAHYGNSIVVKDPSPNTPPDSAEVTVRSRYTSVYATIYFMKDTISTSVDNSNLVQKTERVGIVDGNSVTYEIPDVTHTEYTVTPGQTGYQFVGWSTSTPSNGYYSSRDTREPITSLEVEKNQRYLLYPVFKNANWLIFKTAAVGSGAEYVSPAYVLAGQTAADKKPADPSWRGYKFLYWTTTPTFDEETGELVTFESAPPEFDFNTVLTENQTLYAYWESGYTTYTVITWHQKVSDDKSTAESANAGSRTYEFYSQETREAKVGATVNLTEGDKSQTFVGMHHRTDVDADSHDVVVVSSGSSVLNVFYDRDLMTMQFYNNGNGSGPANGYNDTVWGSNSGLVTTYTGLYGQTLEQNNYTWPDGTWMYYADPDDNTQLSGMSYLGQFVFPDAKIGTYFRAYNTITTNQVSIDFFLQNTDESYSTTRTDYGIVTGGGTFTFTDKYDGFTVAQYRRYYMNGTTKVYVDANSNVPSNPEDAWADTTVGNHVALSTIAYTGNNNDYYWYYTGGGETVIYTGTRYKFRGYNYYSNNTRCIEYSYAGNGSFSPVQYLYNPYEATDNNNTQYARIPFSNGNEGYVKLTRSTSGSKSVSCYLEIRYKRLPHTISYFDSMDGQPLTVQLKNGDTKQSVSGVLYGSQTSGYYPDPSFEPIAKEPGWEFNGRWYSDMSKTTQVFFDDLTEEDQKKLWYYVDTSGEKIYTDYIPSEAQLAMTLENGGRQYAKDEYELLKEMPNRNLPLYAGFTHVWYWIKIDPNGGVLNNNTPNDDTNATYFWEQYGGVIKEYETQRNFIRDDSGEYYYHYAEFNTADPDGTQPSPRDAYYTTDSSKSTDGGLRYREVNTSASEGYVFAGWYKVEDDGSLTRYNFENDIVKGNTILRAMWKQRGAFQVYYSTAKAVDVNGNTLADVTVSGTAPVDEFKYAENASAVVEIGTVTAANEVDPAAEYEFKGWYFNNQVLKAGDVFTLNTVLVEKHPEATAENAPYDTFVLYPVFVKRGEENPGTDDTITKLILDANGGTVTQNYIMPTEEGITVSPDGTQVTFSWVNLPVNSAIPLPEKQGEKQIFSKENAEFLGWAFSRDAKTPVFVAGQRIGVDNLSGAGYNGDNTNVLYAVWRLTKTPVVIHKVDESSKAPLAGAIFQLDSVTGNLTSNSEGYLADTGNKMVFALQTPTDPDEVENYTLVESIPPTDYIAWSTNTVISVDYYGIVTYTQEGGESQKAVLRDGNYIVTVTNQLDLADLTVTKYVTGGFSNPETEFEFTLSGLTSGKTYSYTEAGTAKTQAANDGKITFSLSDGEQMTITLIKGHSYTVTETAEFGYTAQMKLGEGTAETTNSKVFTFENDTELEVTNDYPPPAPTGVDLRVAPYALMLLMGLALMMGLRYGKKRQMN